MNNIISIGNLTTTYGTSNINKRKHIEEIINLDDEEDNIPNSKVIIIQNERVTQNVIYNVEPSYRYILPQLISKADQHIQVLDIYGIQPNSSCVSSNSKVSNNVAVTNNNEQSCLEISVDSRNLFGDLNGKVNASNDKQTQIEEISANNEIISNSHTNNDDTVSISSDDGIVLIESSDEEDNVTINSHQYMQPGDSDFDFYFSESQQSIPVIDLVESTESNNHQEYSNKSVPHQENIEVNKCVYIERTNIINKVVTRCLRSDTDHLLGQSANKASIIELQNDDQPLCSTQIDSADVSHSTTPEANISEIITSDNDKEKEIATKITRRHSKDSEKKIQSLGQSQCYNLEKTGNLENENSAKCKENGTQSKANPYVSLAKNQIPLSNPENKVVSPQKQTALGELMRSLELQPINSIHSNSVVDQNMRKYKTRSGSALYRRSSARINVQQSCEGKGNGRINYCEHSDGVEDTIQNKRRQTRSNKSSKKLSNNERLIKNHHSTVDSKDTHENKEENQIVIKPIEVKLPFSIPKLHLIETWVNRGLTPTQCNTIRQLKLEVKIGHYQKEEDNLILNNWEDFCKLHKLKIDVKHIVKPDVLSQLFPGINRLKFGRFLAHGLPNRCLHSVFGRFQRLLKENQ